MSDMSQKKKLKLKAKKEQCSKCRVEYSATDLVICDPCGGNYCEDCQDQEMCHDCFEEAICCKDKIDELNELHQQEINALKAKYSADDESSHRIFDTMKKEIVALKKENAELKSGLKPKKRSPFFD